MAVALLKTPLKLGSASSLFANAGRVAKSEVIPTAFDELRRNAK